MTSKIYLATPYTGNEEKSFELVNKVAGLLMKYGNVVYSPISQNHLISKAVDLPTDWEYWKRMDTEFIKWCDVLAVLKAPGWRESVGVTAEIKIAEELGKLVSYIPPDKFLEKGGPAL